MRADVPVVVAASATRGNFCQTGAALDVPVAAPLPIITVMVAMGYPPNAERPAGVNLGA
jgi:hypothetical protein